MRFLTSSPMFACSSERSWRKGGRLHSNNAPRQSQTSQLPAASILAREKFIDWLDTAGKRLGVALPRGVSASVKQAARKVVEIGGRDALGTVAKMHFKTAAEVLPATSRIASACKHVRDSLVGIFASGEQKRCEKPGAKTQPRCFV